jgi:hypothetical protein
VVGSGEILPPNIQAYLFSALAFAGGIAGAALTLVSTALADSYGAARVLGVCGLFEVSLGAAATMSFMACRSTPRASEE